MKVNKRILYLLIALFILVLPVPTLAYNSCSELGLQNGGASGRCGADNPCFFDATAPLFTHLCCSSGSGLDRCYSRQTGQYANPDYLQAPSQVADATSTGTTSDFVKAQKSPLYFVPQLTIPGSKFIAGENITLDGSTLGEYIAALYVFMVSAIGILAATMIFYGGIKWIVAAGDRGKIQDAKETISSAIIGIILALTAYLLLLMISPRLVKFTSLTLTPVAGIDQTFVIGEGYGRVPEGTIAISGLNQEWYTKIKTAYGGYITEALQSYPQIEEKLVYALIFVESSGDPNAQSGLACGLMQLKPSTAGFENCVPLLDPKTNINAGVRFLATLLQSPCPTGATCNAAATRCTTTKHSEDYTYVLAAYNAGTGANCYSGGNGCNDGRTKWECPLNEPPPPKGYQQTREYVPKVKSALDRIRTFN